MEQSKISWCDATFNPVIGCTKITEGCTHCYAAEIAARFWPGTWGPKGMRQVMGEAYWRKPLSWNRKAQRTGAPVLVFCGSMCDVFEDHPVADATRPRLWKLIAETPHLTWLLLTKRPARVAAHLPPGWGEGWPHVWLGTSIELPEYRWRADVLRSLPAAGRFLSCEPLLADLGSLDLRGIGWCIVGGESGPDYRPMELAWMQAIANQCIATGVRLHVKQDAARTDGQRGRIPADLWTYKARPARAV
jgi:protein gp37